MYILLNTLNFIESILVNLFDSVSYLDNFLNDVKNVLTSTFAVIHNQIEQYQAHNPEGFIILASICVIFCLCILFFIGAYTSIENEKYERI